LSTKKISIRAANSDDLLAICKVHYDAVHITAAKDYDQQILDQWSSPVNDERVDEYRRRFDPDKEITLVAQINGKVVGLGCFLVVSKELNAIYVSPDLAGQGVGSQLLKELEKIASSKGIKEIWLDSSLTAEKFYSRLGFVSDGQAEHTLRSGQKMACIKMHKRLQD
jgi:putative acetyltransferase